MLHPSTQKLIDRLAEMTAQKKIDWAEADENGGVVYATEGYEVILTANPPHVSLTTEKGRLLEEAAESALSDTPHDEHGDYAELIRKLTGEAARVARGTEAAIDALLAGLDGQAGNRRKTQRSAAPDSADDDHGDEAGAGATAPVDASVPEAALIDEEDDAAHPAFDEDEAGYDEEDVSGAVARLADEVNSAGAGRSTARDENDDIDAFSVTPDGAPHMQDVETVEDIADASSGPIVSEDEETTPGDVWDEAGPEAGKDTAPPRRPFDAYIPFGLGGIEPAGAEVSARTSLPDTGDLDSQLGAASAGMDLGSDEELEADVEGEPGDPPRAIPLDLRPLASKFRFASPGDWTPASQDSYTFSAPDTASDTPGKTADDSILPDLADLTEDDEAEEQDAGAASLDDVDAVAPPTSARDKADEDLFEDNPYSEDMEGAVEESDKGKDKAPPKKRRKSRFNPWS